MKTSRLSFCSYCCCSFFQTKFKRNQSHCKDVSPQKRQSNVISFYIILPFYSSFISLTKMIIVCEQMMVGFLPCSAPFFLFGLFICCHISLFHGIFFNLTPLQLLCMQGAFHCSKKLCFYLFISFRSIDFMNLVSMMTSFSY